MNKSREEALSFQQRSGSAQAPGTLRCAELGRQELLNAITWDISQKPKITEKNITFILQEKK